MTKKILSYSTLCILVSSAGLNAATIGWNSTGTDGDFNTGSSWNGGVAPTATDFARINGATNATLSEAVNVNKFANGGTSTLTVDSGGVLTVAAEILVGEPGDAAAGEKTGTVQLNVGGQIVANTFVQVGGWSALGQESFLNIAGGTLTIGTELRVGSGSAGVLNLSGGTLDLTAGSWQNLRVGSGVGNGTVNMTGGTLTTYGMNMNNDGVGNANFNLDGGTLTVNGGFTSAIKLVGNSVIAIGDGLFQWQGNRNTGIDALISSGNITFATSSVSTITASAEQSWTDGTTTLYADNGDIKSGYTTLWATSAVPEPSAYALLLGSFLSAWVMLRRR